MPRRSAEAANAEKSKSGPWVTSVFCVLMVGALSCGAAMTGREDLNSDIKREDFLTESYKALCSAYVRCGLAKSATLCFEQTNPYLATQVDSLAPLIEAGKVEYDGAKARLCVDAIARLSCDSEFLGDLPRECQLVHEGQAAIGAGCETLECVPSAWCSPKSSGSPPPPGSCRGVCKARVPAGGSATASSQCETGLVLMDSVCVTPAAEGATCKELVFPPTCAAGLRCAADTKTCKKLKLEGESCDSTSLCSGYRVCARGSCTKPGDLADACTASGCKLDFTCDTSKAIPVCSERFGAGATCPKGNECNFGLRCLKAQASSATTCQQPGAAGQACVFGGCGKHLFCEIASKTCKPARSAGEGCTEVDSCETGFCLAGICPKPTPLNVCH